MNTENDRQRRFTSVAKNSAQKLGNARKSQTNRRCPVPGCTAKPKYYSRYCSRHADRLRRNGHPCLSLPIKSKTDYADCLATGRWLRQALSKDAADARAWARVEKALETLGGQERYKYALPTLARRDKTWRNEFKAKCCLSMRLEKVAAEEALAAFLGLSAMVLEGNDIAVSATQFQHFLYKSGGRAVWRFMPTQEIDAVSDKLYEWKPSSGVITRLGKLIFDEIAHEFGSRWWKDAEVTVVTRNVPT